MQLGSTPATAVATTRASGVNLPGPPPSFPVSSNAAAPSLIPLEVAAVTVPSCWNAGFSFATASSVRSEEHTSELQSLAYLVCRLLLEKKNNHCALRLAVVRGRA